MLRTYAITQTKISTKSLWETVIDVIYWFDWKIIRLKKQNTTSISKATKSIRKRITFQVNHKKKWKRIRH